MCSEQRMAPFLPSEIARLVLGYLREEEGTKEAAMEFFNKSPHLGEIRATAKSGTLYTTSINNYTLKEILNEFCSSCSSGATKRLHDGSNGHAQQPSQSPPRLKVPRSSRGAPSYFMDQDFQEPEERAGTFVHRAVRGVRGRPKGGRARGSRGRGVARRGFGRWPSNRGHRTSLKSTITTSNPPDEKPEEISILEEPSPEIDTPISSPALQDVDIEEQDRKTLYYS